MQCMCLGSYDFVAANEHVLIKGSINASEEYEGVCDLLVMQIEIFDSLVLQHGSKEGGVTSTPQWRDFVRVSSSCNWRVSVPLEEMTRKVISKSSFHDIQIVVFTLRRNAHVIHKEASVIPVHPHIATFEHVLTADRGELNSGGERACEEQVLMEKTRHLSANLLLMVVFAILGLFFVMILYKMVASRNDNVFPSFRIPLLWTAETERCNTEKLLQAMADSHHENIVIFSPSSSTPMRQGGHPIGCAG
eukprot:TRINITY_DN585_c0_g1_i1.p1 TRINITY_DN585_c0_g1~~TRINITY_DN585_c0_g1_i1.p1  ORF type:complete len:248 (-),score=54.63 TRINITY_DN585_c0_g1_i1:592-1335(-)